MRIRKPIAAAWLGLLIVFGYLGFADISFQHDKILHGITFFVLTFVFYWTVDTTRRRIANLTFFICTVIGGVGSEFAQAFLTNHRKFDAFDILANLMGSASAILVCAFYHKRMLDRRRQQKYHSVPAGPMDLEAAISTEASSPSVPLQEMDPDAITVSPPTPEESVTQTNNNK